MEALFTHPLTMVAGGALVSAPILIHLINRMRFRRIKWAAMEFLLKAQKRMKRKLILEQLLLLLLRCLLVLLVGLLFARFKWFSPLEGQETRATAHVVVLDDTPSMGDFWRGEDGQLTDAFEQAKLQITEKIAPAAAQANTPQTMELVRLTDLGTPRPFGRLNANAVEEMKRFLGPLKPSHVRVSLADGLRKAKELLDAEQGNDVGKIVHVVSDLRAVDWAIDGDAIQQITAEMAATGIQVHLIDVAFPNRRETDRQPRASDNVGIVEFRPRARVAARYQPIDFELRVKNFGNTELKDVGVRFRLNGEENRIGSVAFPSLPPNQERSMLLPVTLDRIAGKDDPLAAFNLVTAIIETPEPGGLAADNVRHAVVEVRERLKVLVVQGRNLPSDDPKSDGFYLKRLFQDAFGGIAWDEGKVGDLEKRDLRQYSSVYLLNVPTVTEDAAKALRKYVEEGGGLGVFLGPDVRPGEYNKLLYEKYGIFPVPLPSEPAKPPETELTLVLTKQILLRNPEAKNHPAVAGLYTNERGAAVKDMEVERFFYFPTIERYWPVARIGNWTKDASVSELYCLPNKQPVLDYEDAARKLIDKVRARSGEPKFEKHRAFVLPLLDKIRNTAAGRDPDLPTGENKLPPLSKLALYLDRLLCDQINDGDESEPVLREFWGFPEVADLKAEAQQLRDKVKFGDPLYVAKQLGQGRIATMTTTAGDQWTDWPSKGGTPGWVAVVTEMQKYLSGGGSEENRVVGSPVGLTFDSTRYKPSVTRTFVTFDPPKDARAGQPVTVTTVNMGEQPLEAKDVNLLFRFNEAKRPGAYLFTFTRLKGQNDPANAPPESPEFAAYTFNIDTAREGDLRRVGRDDLSRMAPKAAVHSPDDASWLDNLKQKRDDLSTRRWLYLLILIVLILEQAMAVRLSFHAKAEDLEAHAPSAAAAFAHGTPPPVTATVEEAPRETAGAT